MLRWRPKDRKSARDLLKHPWLRQADEYSVWMNKEHLAEFKTVNAHKFKDPDAEEEKKEDE